MCALLSSEAKREIASLLTPRAAHGSNASACLSFARRLHEFPSDARASSRIKNAAIGTPKLLGDKATVVVRESGEAARELTLINTPSGWKISLPPPATTPSFDLRGPTAITVAPPASVSGGKLAQFDFGRAVVAQSGCLACHRIGEAGNAGPGADLTQVGARLPPQGIERAIVDATAPMPSFRGLPKDKLRAVVTFLSLLRE
jgi:mono/diheme cytochrome c family protein